MQDEHFMRQWNAGHVQFSGDIDRAFVRAARGIRRHLGSLLPIGRTYDEGPLARKARLTGNAMIGGLTAGLGLALILLGLGAVSPSETGHAMSSTCVTTPIIA